LTTFHPDDIESVMKYHVNERFDSKYEKTIEVNPRQYKMIIRYVNDEYSNMDEDDKTEIQIMVKISKVH
jgi:hypothetical protein